MLSTLISLRRLPDLLSCCKYQADFLNAQFLVIIGVLY